jgi:hypothetical protein
MVQDFTSAVLSEFLIAKSSVISCLYTKMGLLECARRMCKLREHRATSICYQVAAWRVMKGQAKVKGDKGGRFGILARCRDACAGKRSPSVALGMTAIREERHN